MLVAVRLKLGILHVKNGFKRLESGRGWVDSMRRCFNQ